MLMQCPQSAFDAIAFDRIARFTLGRKTHLSLRIARRKNEKDQISVPHRAPVLDNLAKLYSVLQPPVTHHRGYTAIRLRPLILRLRNTARPAREDMRARKPWTL